MPTGIEVVRLREGSASLPPMTARTSSFIIDVAGRGPALRPGTKVDFGIVDGRRGKQALSVTILETPSVAKGSRKPADDMAVIIEDVIKLLDGMSGQLRRGRYPSDDMARKGAAVLRAVADDLDV